jgi:hypothetical protein
MNFVLNLSCAICAVIALLRAEWIEAWWTKHLGDWPLRLPLGVWIFRIGAAYLAVQFAYFAWFWRPWR